MSKKSTTKSKKQKVSSKEQLQGIAQSAQKILAGHGVFVMIVVAGLSIGFALYKSRSYLNPYRDEAKYSELSVKNNYSKIDYTLVEKLSEVLTDAEITVSQDIAPGRENPFSE
jgi:hypothetical protein